MNRFAAAGALALALSTSLPALALPQRTFVSVSGSDGQPCTVTLPCRSFAAAMANTNAGGEIIVLDSGGYGAVTITKSVSIVSPPGVYAGISVFNSAGVTVSAGSSDTVKLRGLYINAQGGSRGVYFTSGGRLEIESCTISGAFTHGIGISAAATPRILIKDTHIEDAGVGIDMTGPGGEFVRLALTDSVLSHVGFGINIATGAEVTIDNSKLIGPYAFGGTGVLLTSTSIHTPVRVHVANTLIREFGVGVATAQQASTAAMLSVASSEISHVSIGVNTNGGAIALSGNRFVYNNTLVNGVGAPVITSSGTNYAAYYGVAGTPVTAPVGAL